MTNASTTGGTTTASDPMTTNVTLDSTTTVDPTTESAPTTDSSDSTTGDPPATVCESFCATMNVCCTADEGCSPDPGCLESCAKDLQSAQLSSASCLGLYEDIYSCAATDCEAFLGYYSDSAGECWAKQKAAWSDPACDPPPPPPECVQGCAKLIACDPDLTAEECESECSSDIFNAESGGDLACEQALKQIYVCIAGLTCEQIGKGEGCEELPVGCG